MEILEVLKAHAKRYPLMQPEDAVKLIYQNEFGGGHLISDPEKSLEWIRREYAATERDPKMPLIEDLGNDIVRLHFQSLDTETLSLETINELFVRSAELHTGSMEQFAHKLTLLEERFTDIGFSFDGMALDDDLERYRAAGCAMVSHSEMFRDTYKPSYRVVMRSLLPDKIA